MQGEYEATLEDGHTYQFVFLKNGIVEWYLNGINKREYKWSIVDGEIHGIYDSGEIGVHRINPDKSITLIASIVDEKRTDWPKDKQETYKKIK